MPHFSNSFMLVHAVLSRLQRFLLLRYPCRGGSETVFDPFAVKPHLATLLRGKVPPNKMAGMKTTYNLTLFETSSTLYHITSCFGGKRCCSFTWMKWALKLTCYCNKVIFVVVKLYVVLWFLTHRVAQWLSRTAEPMDANLISPMAAFHMKAKSKNVCL